MKEKETGFISLVVYLRNCEEGIGNFLTKVDGFLQNNYKNYEFILVDDASTDTTSQKIGQVEENIVGDITLVQLAWKHGTDLGILAGVDAAIGDFVYEIESTNLDYPLKIINELFNKCTSGYDIVSATPQQNPKYISRLFYNFLNRISYLNLNIESEPIRLVSRRAVNKISSMDEKTQYRKILYKYSGFAHEKITYHSKKERDLSKDRGFLEKVSLASDLLVSFSNIGLHIATFLSLFFLAGSLSIGAYSLYVYLFTDLTVPGWTSQMLLISGGFTGVFFVLATLSKYISVLMLESKERPLYTTDKVEKL